MPDLIIRQARVVDTTQDQIADVAIERGVIQEVAPTINDTAPTEIDASGLLMIPGGIDPHVHFNEPGRTDWEGFETGSRALAKGGITTFFDMPLNSTPPTNTFKDFEIKRRIAQEKSLVNFELWSGLTPDNLSYLEQLAQEGVIAFKAFMSNSGIDDFKSVDDYSLYRGMEILAKHDAIVAVHAENDSITARLSAKAVEAGKLSVRDYLDSRPIIAEIEAIQRAILFAETTACRLHIVHVSSYEGVEVIRTAKKRGADVTCETCPHYLVFTDEDVERLGAVAKCAPPIRSQVQQEALWKHLMAGDIDFVASDHSPAPMSMKQGDNFFAIWGGISGCQSTLPIMLTEGYHKRGLPLQQIVALTSYNASERFGLTDRARFYHPMQADFVLIDLDEEWTLTADDLEYKHAVSPYIGMQFKGQIKSTWVKGKKVYG